MRQRNHKCEACGKLYVTIGNRRIHRNFCSDECRRIVFRREQNAYQRLRYHVDPVFRAHILALNHASYYRRRSTPEGWQAIKDTRERWKQRKAIEAQLGRLIRRIAS